MTADDMTIAPGSPAPDFTAPVDGGGTLRLSSLKGRNVVLYFYPKDSTPGCTTEACAFRDALPDFTDAGAAVVGVSKDSVRRHENFKQKNDLNFTLVSDADGDICERYGVWTEKSMYGRKYMGIERATFLIDGQGIVRCVWRKVRVKGHADEVLAAVRAL